MSRRFSRLAIRIAALPCLLAVAAAPAFSEEPCFGYREERGESPAARLSVAAARPG